MDLEKEAKEFQENKRKKGTPPTKSRKNVPSVKTGSEELTPRLYLAGQAMSALLSSATGPADLNYLKTESFKIADEFLK